MLSIGRLGSSGGADYYLDKVANSVDDYYLGRGEAPGQWIGAAAETLGLSGQVEAEALRNLLAATSAEGEALGLQVQPGRRPGYDLTFSAPKGISLLWAFGSDEIRETVSVAHDRAIAAVLGHLSAEACYARRGHAGTQLIEAKGFIGAAFRHRTSRAGDPQLHTHVVVPNLVQGADGRWSAPDGRHLFAWKMTAGTLYRSALRAELAPLGLDWDIRRNGLSELRDVPKSVLRAFSKRRTDIEQAMEERGSTSAVAAANAALATRARKPGEALSVDVMRAGWLEQLGNIELPDGEGGTRKATVEDVTAGLVDETVTSFGPAEVEEVFRILAGERGASLDDWEIDEQHLADSGAPGIRALPVTLLGSTFTRRDAMSALARAFDVTPDEAAALTARFLEREGVVRVLADPGAGPEHIRTRSGHVVRATSGDRRYTTTELLAAEQRIIASAAERIGEGSGRVAPEMVEEVLGLHPYLDGEQADGVRALLSSGNGYDLVIGQAGTGKSTLLEASRIGWEEAGYRVIGTAVAARTAADLEAGTGIASSSLTQLLADLAESGGLTSRHVIVLDEASMVGSRPLDQLRSYVDGAGAKLVLLGDNRQLSSIDAGGALRSLSSELGDHVVTLTTNRRQAGSDQQWERDALVALRHGDVAAAVDAYVDHGRVTMADNIDGARQRIVEDWWSVHHAHTTAILAVRRSDVAALNDLVRARRRDAGELGPEIRIGAKVFSVGDRVIFEKNQRVRSADPGSQHGELVKLRNGTFGTVVAVTDPTGKTVTREGDVGRVKGDVAGGIGEEARTEATGSLVVQLDDGRRAILPRSYAEASTSLGYALTVFRSQGITVDHTFGLGGDSLFQEAGYTALSRGRLSNNLYVAAPENPRWEIGHHTDDVARRDALESLVGALFQSKEQTMARDRLPTWPAVSVEKIAAAYRERASLEKWIADHAPPDAVRQLADTSFGAVDIDERARTRAQGDVTNSDAAKRRLVAWAVRHQAEIEMWSELEHELRRHEYRLGQAAAYSQPEHTLASLGPLPVRISAAERWQFSAGAIEAYRVRWNVTDADALGPEPLDPDQRAHWERALSTLGSAGLGAAGGPREGPDEAGISSLWDRVHALDTAPTDPARDVAFMSEAGPFASIGDVDVGQNFDDGFGL
jgi:conjugative relaxase-like TrwC/TraI family protein